MKKIPQYSLLTGLFLSLVSSQAAQAATPYPNKGFDVVGNIDRLDQEQNMLIINDGVFFLDKKVALYTQTGAKGSLGRLHKGVRIGAIYKSMQKSRLLTDIWLVPSNYKATNSRTKKSRRN